MATPITVSILLDSKQRIQITPNKANKSMCVCLIDAAGNVIAEAEEDANAMLKGIQIVHSVAAFELGQGIAVKPAKKRK